MKIIRNGNLVGWVSSLLGFIGVNIGFYAVVTLPNNSVMQLLIATLGITIAGFATNSDRAITWKIKSFGNLTFPPNKPGEKTPPEGLLEKIISWAFFAGTALSIYLWISY